MRKLFVLSHTLRQNKFINNYPPAPGGFGGQVGVGYKSCIAVLGGSLKTTPLGLKGKGASL